MKDNNCDSGGILMKLSRFNIEHPVSDGLILYNTLSSGILLLEKEDIKDYFNIKNECCLSNEKLKNELCKGRMLIDKEFDEIEFIKFTNTASRFSGRGLGLTIAPTLYCNFACPYCFEKGVKFDQMSDEVILSLVSFIKNYIGGKEPLSITWYGGEPLLAIDIIERITKLVFDDSEYENMNYSSDIITNGYLLTRNVAKKLKNLGITNVQITLDGPPRIHDSRRKLISGGKTFDRILKNIKETCDLIDITIRVNLDRTNQDDVKELIDIIKFEGLYDKVFIYVAKVDDFFNDSNPSLLTSVEFSEKYNDFLTNNKNYIQIAEFNPNVCGAVNINSFVIDPSGNMYKCWDEIGRDEGVVGNVSSGIDYNKTFFNYINNDPLSSEKCLDCKILPLCMGGCPFQKKISGDSVCRSKKYSIESELENIYMNTI